MLSPWREGFATKGLVWEVPTPCTTPPFRMDSSRIQPLLPSQGLWGTAPLEGSTSRPAAPATVPDWRSPRKESEINLQGQDKPLKQTEHGAFCVQ